MAEEVEIEIECDHCNATGILEPDRFGLAYICDVCRGKGKLLYRYTPFTGRRNIVRPAGTTAVSEVQWRTFGAGPAISYGAFVGGGMPELKWSE